MDDNQLREAFDTGLAKVRQELKSRLAGHGLYGSVTNSGTTVELIVKGKKVARTFDRQEIEACRLRVGGPVLAGLVAMVDEVTAWVVSEQAVRSSP